MHRMEDVATMNLTSNRKFTVSEVRFGEHKHDGTTIHQSEYIYTYYKDPYCSLIYNDPSIVFNYI